MHLCESMDWFVFLLACKHVGYVTRHHQCTQCTDEMVLCPATLGSGVLRRSSLLDGDMLFRRLTRPKASARPPPDASSSAQPVQPVPVSVKREAPEAEPPQASRPTMEAHPKAGPELRRRRLEQGPRPPQCLPPGWVPAPPPPAVEVGVPVVPVPPQPAPPGEVEGAEAEGPQGTEAGEAFGGREFFKYN